MNKSISQKSLFSDGGGLFTMADGDFRFFSIKDPIRTIYGVVDSTVLLFGVTLNTLLIYLIRTKTEGGMKIYSKLLTVSCTIDLIVSVCTFITGPIPCVDHGYRMVLMNGMFRHASQPIRYGLYLVWIQLMLFFLVTTMSQYVYRFCILCRNGEISRPIFLGLVFANVFLNVFHGVFITWADYLRVTDLPEIEEIRRAVANETGFTDIRFVSFVYAHDFRWLLHNLVMCILIPVFYGVIFICSMKIRAVIREINVFKFKEINNQVSSALLFQALLPTFEISAWCAQMFVPLVVKKPSTALFSMFTDVPIHLVPVLNPIGTMLLVAPYRRALLHLLGLSRWARGSSSTKVIVISRQFTSQTTQQIGVGGSGGGVKQNNYFVPTSRRGTRTSTVQTISTNWARRQS